MTSEMNTTFKVWTEHPSSEPPTYPIGGTWFTVAPVSHCAKHRQLWNTAKKGCVFRGGGECEEGTDLIWRVYDG